MEWKEVDICQLCDSVSETYKGNASEVVLINTSDVLDGKCLNHEYVPNKKLKGQFKKTFRKGDILYSEIRPANKRFCFVDFEPKDYIASTKLMVLRAHEDVDPQYLYQILRSNDTLTQLQMLAESRSGTFPQITYSELSNIMVSLPSQKAQKNIVSILSSLDRKIELNNKINADLEEMAQAIFKNWFVDFEPFKDGKFVDSELGMIPEGWKIVVFDNILKVTTTKTGKEGIPEYSVTNTGIHPRDEKFTKNLSKSSAKNKLIRKGNLVFGMSREILNWGIMKEEVGGVSSAYNVYIVDEKIVNTTYLECFIAQRMDYFADLIKPASREGQGVDKALLMKKIICIPPSEVMDVFLEKYNSIMHLTEIRNQENSRLSLLRDTLLPRLMSGEIEVPE